ncbi:MAG: hypothetical protein V4813_04625 [Gemmatimonadota bacterium]
MTTRRYGDDEVREIFSLATTGDLREPSLPAESGGLTLDALERIGQEAGIEPARVAQAAATLNARGHAFPLERAFGVPIGVSRMVALPRAPTDREWQQLMTHCRTTFGVQGVATESGGHRAWSHGNLSVSIEPTAEGEQLRLTTRNEAAVVLNGLGVVLGGMSLLTSLAVVAAGKPEKALVVLTLFGGVAVAAFATNLWRAPRWARTRDRQMATVAEHAVHMLAKVEAAPPPGVGGADA